VEIGDKARVEDVYGKSILIEEKAQARNVYGENITIEEGCNVTGEVQYTVSLEAERGVYFAKQPVKVDRLPEKP